MQTLIIVLLVGNSGNGKTSFINTLLGETVSQVGSEGVSETFSVNAYDVGESNILFKNHPPGSRLIILDTPGFQDSNMRFLDKNITDSITSKLIELGKESIDLVLLFESAFSSSISLRPTLKILLNEFGESILQSMVGVVTKLDKLNDKEKSLRRAALSNFTQFPLVEWINDTNDKKISSELKSSQISKLSSAIKGKQPYHLSSIDKLEQQYESLAKKLRDEDNDRFEIKTECFIVKVPVSRVVDEEYVVYEKAYETEEEIRKRAEELRVNSGKYSVQKVRQITEEFDEEYIDIKRVPREVAYYCPEKILFITIGHTCYTTVYDEVKVTKYRRASRIVPEEYTDYEYYPVENFIEKAMSETKPVSKIRKNTIHDIKEEKKCEDTMHEKHNFLYYKEKARLKIEENFKNLCRQ